MEILKHSLSIDAEKVCSLIEAFIKDNMTSLRRAGIVVPISGGLDSSVVASLCVRAIGNEKVVGLLLPEKQGNPDAVKFAKMLAQHLGIATKTINISKILRSLGTYRFALSFLPSRKLKASVVKKFLENPDDNFFLKGIRGTDSKLVNHGMASFYTKQRIRLVSVFKYAEENNLMVVGSAHKTEDMVGLYVKFGVDDAADLMPLKHLYRTHILQLAHYLGVPSAITTRTPNPDLVPGVNDKYMDILGIASDTLDLILYGLEKSLPVAEIVKQTGIAGSTVEMVAELVELTRHMRNPSMAPQLL